MIQNEGPGWRLARDESKKTFPVLIGGEGWAFELRDCEWRSLVPLVRDLSDEHKKLEDQLMPEETLCLEIEREPWWGCLSGDRSTWDLRIILEANEGFRGVEGYWPFPAAQAIASAMRTMWDSCN